MSKITLTCDTCNKEFEKARKEYNRRIRLGKDKFYCGLSCAGKSPENVKHIVSNGSGHPVWELNNPKKQDRPRDFNLTLEYLKEIWETQEGKCPFTGFDLELRTYKSDSQLNIKSASLDRIDNSKGYVQGNVRFVSVMFNFARNKFSDEEVIEFAQAVIKNRG